jgi:hypothetical protein
MLRQVFLTSNGLGGYHRRMPPIDTPIATVLVRRRDPDQPFDGVWVNGERAFETNVFIDGVWAYWTPIPGVGRHCFQQHEERGGGYAP